MTGRAAGDGVLRTARLDLLPWPEHHPGLVAELTVDPRVTRFLGTGEVWPRERADGWQQGMTEFWARHGFGARAAVRRADGAPVGLAISCLVGEGVGDLDPAAHELGWWLAPGHWRRGLGTEIGLALRAEAHEVLGADAVLARLQTANLGSAGIARRIGLVHDHDTVGRFGEPNAIYTGTRAGWAARDAVRGAATQTE